MNYPKVGALDSCCDFDRKCIVATMHGVVQYAKYIMATNRNYAIVNDCLELMHKYTNTLINL